MVGSSFTPSVSRSSARVGCRCPCRSFSHALIGALQYTMVGSSSTPPVSSSSAKTRLPLPLPALLARINGSGRWSGWRWAPASLSTCLGAAPGSDATAPASPSRAHRQGCWNC
eukprot:8573198-Pyramimonas_sp.AAC.1